MSKETNPTGILNTILAGDAVGATWSTGKRRGSRTCLLAGQDPLGEGNRQWGRGPILDEDRDAASLRARGKAQSRFDTCLTKMRIPTSPGGYVRWR